MIIKNYNELARTDLRKKALSIILSGVESVLPKNLLNKKISFKNNFLQINGEKFEIKGDIYIIGGGKSSGKMAEEIEKIIGLDRIKEGFINDKIENNETKKIKVHKGGHPIPDESSIIGVKEIFNLTKNLKIEDTVICLLSGGGSALLEMPVEEISLQEIKILVGLLLKSGAEVFEINIIRKHLSKIKGGKLLRYLQPARIISLIFSDTIDTEYDATASGPTSPDKSTFLDAYNILKKYNLIDKTPKKIIEYLYQNINSQENETIKPMNPLLNNVHNFIIADNSIALTAMKQSAVKLGYTNVRIITNKLKGESKEIGKKMGKFFRGAKPGVYIYGGELTVTVNGGGKGGRLQEYTASLIPEISSIKNCVTLSFGSDGVDFINGIGGAIADNETMEECINKNLDILTFIKNNNTYQLHKELKNIIKSDPTNTNVADLHVCIIDN